ncbi:glycosyltransferase family 1 protein [Echinicola jeungdonensis]|uniref:Glycosyltransferase family 4 protein n=1 Tax=Echinicola jeungdonensis TaxID=709343 RepID=A0ABV5J6N2_9BACT|nr:glycosyltransferase family 1 protein [Echinicola jeungdonensis]MDN3669273.1 glycosyltransferase family 1 protein [Echinicola jeungdonensis]
MSIKKIRIAIDTRDLFLAKTGTRTVLEEVINGFKKDHEVEVVEIRPKAFSPPRTKIEKAVEHIRFFWWKEVQLPLSVKKNQCDVLICNDYVVPYFLPKGIKAFPIFHGCNIWELPQHYNKYWRFFFTKMAVLAAKRAKAIFTVSEFSKERLIALFNFAPSKVKVIPLGPKRSLLSPKPLVNIENYGIKEGEKFLLHVGVMEKRKNLVKLIEAFSKIIDRNLKLVLVGQRPPKIFSDDYKNIVSTISRLNLNDKVILTGYVTDEELFTLYSRASAYVFPSLYEGFGIPVIEAYHFSLPVAASNRGALPEVIGNGGLLFDPNDVDDIADKLKRISNLSELETDKFQIGQKEKIRGFQWEKTINEIKKNIG